MKRSHQGSPCYFHHITLMTSKYLQRSSITGLPESNRRIIAAAGEKLEEDKRAPEAHGKATNAENFRSREREQPLLDPLSTHELEVLCLLARGNSNHEIAKTLVIAIETVKLLSVELHH